MNKKFNFNKRSKAYLATLGYVTEMVEHYNAFSGRKHDFCGFSDAICLNPDVTTDKIVCVQITSKNNLSARFKKITEPIIKDEKTKEYKLNPVPDKAKLWLKAGGGIWVLTFDAKSTAGKLRKVFLGDDGQFAYTDHPFIFDK